ncbi:MAG TPA: TQO small subunit DoxD [Gemmatimonadales bacterium]|nr:TQO small subunit DoxD [Gemmatimonadales bacterium]
MRLPGLVLQGILARAALVFLRLYLGFAFLLSSWLKLDLQTMPKVSYVSAVTVGELLLGVALLLGILTRFSAALALIVSIGYLYSSGTWLGPGATGHAAHAAISIALLVGAAGRTLGVDAVLARRWPRSPLW